MSLLHLIVMHAVASASICLNLDWQVLQVAVGQLQELSLEYWILAAGHNPSNAPASTIGVCSSPLPVGTQKQYRWVPKHLLILLLIRTRK